ncbi:dihydrolipoamide acetyltransferase family protein [Cryobacterium tepidiphilum]|uniref:Dihydrolipoamide acetyltransferase component of pyruvate dehydrogenase complex n=1 Tax=Cryobacterium tepidiphilum TaxID=2486026 RepID=A0A3M8LFD7_9MICO|nr:dihydrolipoamide acetyltransferase family protein [Cryobacterium tepidiphilum]RNE64181.1 2-oxo acid dehydrogenase subunit E2 [Cryobacterium tepidiphilum]
MIEITMPRLSDTMEEGAIATWHKKEGDQVNVGDILVEIETDKATMEYEAYEAGTLAKILVQEGELVPIGRPIAQLDDGKGGAPATDAPSSAAGNVQDTDEAGSVQAAEDAARQPEARAGATGGAAEQSSVPTDEAKQAQMGGSATGGEQPANAELSAAEAPAAGEAAPAAPSGERQFASPYARKLARENQLDLSQVQGSGPGGRIVRTDIDALLAKKGTAAPAPAAAPQQQAAPAAAQAPTSADQKRGSEQVEVSKVRRVIARRLGESARSIPHFYVTAKADAEALVQLRTALNTQLVAAGRPKVSINDLVVRAVSLALREHPLVNASYVSDESAHMLVHKRINVGIAVAGDNGLVVPVITDADQKTASQLGVETKQLVALANSKKLTTEQMSGGTFTISNLGMFGVEEFTAIINPPEGAILAVGGTKPEAVVVDGEIVARNQMRYTLSADHRIIDGALAAQFLQTLTRLIENPWTIIA